jgi:alanyl-tRNA synthetase
MGSADEAAARGIKAGERIFYYDAKENWWSRAGVLANMPVGEIGGGDSEMFYDFDPSGAMHDPKYGERCHPACDCGRFMEIGNSVFMEYVKTETGFEKLPAQNVDFGGGLERIAAAAADSPDVYVVDLLENVITQIEQLSGKSYADQAEPMRIITDHIRGAVMMIGDGVLPSNSEQGYFVRRLIRRAVRYADVVGVPAGSFAELADSVITSYQDHYVYLKEKRDDIKTALASEETQFRKTLEKGTREFEKIVDSGSVSGRDAFVLFTTYGFPYELTEELAGERGVIVDRVAFDKEMSTHQATSRAGAEQKFKGGLADQSDAVVQYHTATHLLLAALRHFLGDHVHQAGSNITGERLRFDFTHSEKVEREQLDQIEAWVNEQIESGGAVTIETMPKTVAENDPTVEGSFWDRYPDEVKVYTMKLTDETVVSRELCGGPHVQSLTELTPTFTIKKEESSSAGVRRIKAVFT